jgi:hypothetical protein
MTQRRKWFNRIKGKLMSLDDVDLYMPYEYNNKTDSIKCIDLLNNNSISFSMIEGGAWTIKGSAPKLMLLYYGIGNND